MVIILIFDFGFLGAIVVEDEVKLSIKFWLIEFIVILGRLLLMFVIVMWIMLFFFWVMAIVVIWGLGFFWLNFFLGMFKRVLVNLIMSRFFWG